jgi:hypothetical protein
VPRADDRSNSQRTATRVSKVQRQSSDALRGEYAFLEQIYAELDDPDALLGLPTLQFSTDLADQARAHSAAGHWCVWGGGGVMSLLTLLRDREDALAAYDALVQRAPHSTAYQRGRLESLRSLGMFDNVAMLVRAALPPPARADAASRELLAHVGVV